MTNKEIMLSGVVIAKNNEKLLGDCIASISFCDEIIVVDGGSTDGTVQLAKKLGARVVQGAHDNFSRQREIGKEEARGKWILYIDTDERVSQALTEEILQTISTENGTHAFRLKRQNYYLGNHPWPTVEKLERLFQKKYLKGWYGTLHETARVEGEIGELHGILSHYTHRDLSSMLAKTIEWSGYEAQLRLDAHHPKMTWWRFPRVMLTAFYDSYIRQSGWKVGIVGLIESMYQAYSMFITYARVWEMQQKK